MAAIRAKITGGEIVPHSPKEYRDLRVKNEGREVVVSIKRFQMKRSLDSNAYYWGVVVPYWMEQYKEPDSYEMHTTLMLLYSYKMVGFGDELLRKPLRSSTMEQPAFSRHIDKAREGFAIEYGFEIPDANSAIAQEMIDEYHKLGNARERMD